MRYVFRKCLLSLVLLTPLGCRNEPPTIELAAGCGRRSGDNSRRSVRRPSRDSSIPQEPAN